LQGRVQRLYVFHFPNNTVELFGCDFGHPVFKMLSRLSPGHDVRVSTLSVISESPKPFGGWVGYKARETTPELHAPIIARLSEYC
jgi:hypothetical protein